MAQNKKSNEFGLNVISYAMIIVNLGNYLLDTALNFPNCAVILINIIVMHEEARKEAYRLLPAPLPIQRGEPHPTSSLLAFIEERTEESILPSRQNEELFPVIDRIISKKNIHQIGQSLPALFAFPVYKSHEALDTSNNQKFCSWSTDQNYRINTVHTSYDIPQGGLSFESRFESGNLGIVSMCEGNPYAYFLALQRDVNSTSGTTQWFYFKASSAGAAGTYTFHIVNYVKPFSMFRVGMKPCVYSPSRGSKWERAGTDIDYRRNSLPYEQDENYYTLSFSYEFQAGEGDVYFAYCYPYTYSRLQRFLDAVEAKHFDRMRRKVIAKTLGGNVVEQISITNPQILNKRILYFTARTHPGETVSSFVCEAIIEFLLSHPEAEKMRNQFIIKIVPMLNPDGVVNGSYRCSLSGSDLNREWKNPSKSSHPQIYNIKKIILQSQYKKLLFVDIHGHSKKKASFMYGCVSARSPYAAKELPYLLSRRMSHFNYFSCNFATPRSKEGTSRITLWRAGIDHSYTYEVSFCGPQKDRRHFSVLDLYGLGIELCRTLCSYFYSRILQLEIDDQLNRHCQEFYNDEELMNVGNEETNGSSSELEDESPHEQRLIKGKSKIFRRTVRGHNATEKTETGRLNDLLDQYMRKQVKQAEDSQELREKQRNMEKDVYLRQRQSFIATRVNIQQIQNDSILPSMSTYYGFAVQKNEPRSSSLRSSAELALQQTHRREVGQSFGILLPNVQKNQYKRYQRPERYKKDKNLGDRSVSVYVQNLMQSQAESRTPSPYQIKLNREISLGERIRSRISDKF